MLSRKNKVRLNAGMITKIPRVYAKNELAWMHSRG
jgi:hypothetical protein